MYSNQLLGNSVSREDFYLGYERFSSIVALLTFAGINVYHNIKAVKKTDCYEKLKEKVKNNVPPKVDVLEVELRNFHGGRRERRFSSSLYSSFRESDTGAEVLYFSFTFQHHKNPFYGYKFK